jgi:hypothetical protein
MIAWCKGAYGELTKTNVWYVIYSRSNWLFIKYIPFYEDKYARFLYDVKYFQGRMIMLLHVLVEMWERRKVYNESLWGNIFPEIMKLFC